MGAFLCLLSAACFGVMAVFGKLAFDAGVPLDALLLVRFTLAAAILVPLASARRDPMPRGRLLVTAFGLGAVGYAAQAGLFFSALRRMDAALLSLVLYTFPIFVTVGAVLLGRDRFTAGRVVALVAASGGTLLVLLGAGAAAVDPFGVVLGFGAALTYTAYILVADGTVRRIAPVPLAALVMSGAAVTLWLRALGTGGVGLSFGAAGWLWLGCIAVVSTVAAMLTFFAGLRRVGPSSAAILSTFEPVVTVAAAAVVLGESLRPTQFAGGVLVLVAATVVASRRPVRADGTTARADQAGIGASVQVVPAGGTVSSSR
ncbi:hypothetical protein Val02_52990 [Virgisporangium aliadipatigenens]|uniref:EamA domain-containing protein n=1 Tax=Virgisporangium aliadipatigenens TaxID=741659 RepID=A0A8J3YRG4_9ACTN|nr:DMT family transporter [Virgisporangium aliadipatigenens]GIJ48413.1 hypothetical protein Val02_52990 [Virgisporangium aliadipatigenens]